MLEDPKAIFFFLGVFVGAIVMLCPLIYCAIKLDISKRHLKSQERISHILQKRLIDGGNRSIA